MALADGPWYDGREREWYVILDGAPWRDETGARRLFLTADDARDAVEREVYAPRRAEG